MTRQKTEIGSTPADPKYKIVVTDKGPYLVYGRPPFAQQFIMPNALGESWYFQQGKSFSTDSEPTALCRCGASKNRPYCDNSHIKAEWNPKNRASKAGLLDNVEITSADTISVTDNRKYCVFARFCDAATGVWALTEASDNPFARRLAIRQASLCPGGRLMAWDNDADRPYEPNYPPSLGLIEDNIISTSGGLWVRGGISIEGENGEKYEIRNRTVLCRCGKSSNKPYCDGTHAAAGWRDGLEGIPEGVTVPEEVY